ncbi:CesT family type III secretion system chaperone [Pokkaliibacter sp. MBI-7]|uniref:CesT family type III secretion system chaperone n=1 Tax=Pokkaliibacter sp. MBI-7 TaxID=3040600 RepID=UPI00244A98EC|nr:CesT family type III secretion system chaperone [Pokkaliibacter sp. MBI-7]MDH2433907.1 CesT family type III secretion system chaperone [Pokkaliibacter sp. MBI-7]
MDNYPTQRLEYALRPLGADPAQLEALRQEGHLLWPLSAGSECLLVPGGEGNSVFIIHSLTHIDPEQDGRLLALALHLNLSPAHTLNASIALDIEQRLLCLRYCHSLISSDAEPLGQVLQQLHQLCAQLQDSIRRFRQDQQAGLNRAQITAGAGLSKRQELQP